LAIAKDLRERIALLEREGELEATNYFFSLGDQDRCSS
jgi:hypothetical protein